MTDTTPTATVPGTPSARAWLAAALTAFFFAVLYIPTLFLASATVAKSDAWADVAYVVVALFAYGVITVVAIPLLAHTLGRFVDRRTRRLPVVGAALIFAMFAALLGSMLALPMSLDGAFGWLPWLSYVAVPALAAFVARVLLDRAIASRRARTVAF